MTQRSLSDLTGSTDSSGDDESGVLINRPHTDLLSDEAELADDSCPWCLHPADDFSENSNGTVGCGNCDAVIPTESEWYKRGEKIVV